MLMCQYCILYGTAYLMGPFSCFIKPGLGVTIDKAKFAHCAKTTALYQLVGMCKNMS